MSRFCVVHTYDGLVKQPNNSTLLFCMRLTVDSVCIGAPQIVNICVDVLTEEKEDGGKRLEEGLAQLSSGAPDVELCPPPSLFVLCRSIPTYRHERGSKPIVSTSLREPTPCARSLPTPCKTSSDPLYPSKGRRCRRETAFRTGREASFAAASHQSS